MERMPRQPFLPTFAHLDYAVGALVLNDRPELASAIGRCIAIWSQVDNEMGNLFGVLLGTDSEPAVEVFLTLRRWSNQTEALQAAAKHKLSGEDARFFKALLSAYGSLEKERSALAHGCFGVASNDPSVLLWIEVKDHVHFQSDVLTRLARGESMPDPHRRLKEKMFVYRLSDLQALQNEMEECWDATRHFHGYLREPASSSRRAAYDAVKTLPRFSRQRTNANG